MAFNHLNLPHDGYTLQNAMAYALAGMTGAAVEDADALLADATEVARGQDFAVAGL